jgi:cyclophilin family peptidyl-prolyl cis-trans isomerase/HEAT repeat protein
MAGVVASPGRFRSGPVGEGIVRTCVRGDFPFGRRRWIGGALLAFGAAGCASAPGARPAGPTAPVAAVSLDQKAQWILQLEQMRVLRDPALPAPTPAPVMPAADQYVPAAVADLVALVHDPDPAVRRRSALAIGRVGLAQGAPSLTAALGDVDENVRATAAFGLGLLGLRESVEPLTALLKDASAAVRGRAIQALGLVGDPTAVAAIADASGSCGPLLAPIDPDSEVDPAPDVEACRLALYAFVRLKAFDALARVALDAQGEPIARWWPVAFALQRIGDSRAVPALEMLLPTPGIYTAGFALKGLAAAGDRRVVPTALALAARPDADVKLRVAAVRALAQVGGADAVEPLLTLLGDPDTPATLRLEVVTALGAAGDHRAFDPLLDLITAPQAPLRAAALAAAARIDPEGFLLVLSSTRRDPDPAVRASLAGVLAGLPADRVRGQIMSLVADGDPRVEGPALEALVRIGAPDLPRRLFDALAAPDFVVRSTAADLVGELKPEGGAARLVTAYERGDSDATYAARLAALVALSRYGGEDAQTTLRRALGDREWPVRLRAAALLEALGEPGATPERPAPVRQPAEFFGSPAILHPAYSPHAFVETRHGTIEIELDVVESPVTTASFVELARSGFFNGLKVHRLVPGFVIQTGDPRGDGEGGPGYTIRDELSSTPYLRGTVGMALGGKETGGSQFFITLSPQPHLDAQYTAFGRVVRGDEVLDLIEAGDVIERIRIWDGVRFQ